MMAGLSQVACAQSNGAPALPRVRAADGTQLFYRDWGDGSPVVFSHPWALNADIWEYQLTELSEIGVRCIAYDRRGHGRSADPGRGYDYDTLAADLAAVIEQLDLQDVTLVGYSMGSAEVIRYLSRYGGERVSRVVLVSPVPPAPVSGTMFDAFIAALKQDRPAFIAGGISAFLGQDALVSAAMAEWVRSLFLAASPKALIECTRSIAAGDHRPHLGALDMPTLIIQGDKDDINPLEVSGRALAEAIGGSELRVYEGAPHGIVLTHRQRFTNDLLAFLGTGG